MNQSIRPMPTLPGRQSLRHITLRTCAAMLGIMPGICSAASSVDPGIPHLEKHGAATEIVVDQKPMLALSGEVHNSSGSSPAYMQPIWPRLAHMHLNTVIVSASWELIEPAEGQFDFSVVDGLIDGARANHLKLVFLWFGSWKNGLSSYPPLWVKTNPSRFPLAKNSKGESRDILSTFGEATCAADSRAFAALMHHLRDADTSHTVVAVQVENEVGMREDSRDRSPAANAAFDAAVPEPLMKLFVDGGPGIVPELRDRWAKAGKHSNGTWTQVFGSGLATDELFMAWQYATFVGKVAAAGKAEYPIPMYANCWLDQPGTPNPGDYPSGGPLAHLLNVWQLGAPALDFLSPDLYVGEFEYRCRIFTRAGNPLFIPETNTGDRAGANALLAFGKFNAMGFSPFGIDGFMAAFGLAPPGTVDSGDDEPTPLSRAYEALDKMMPAVLAARGTGSMTAVMLGPGSEDATAQKKVVHLGGYTLTVTPRRLRFRRGAPPTTKPAEPATLAGLFISTGPDEFLVVTTGLDVDFAKDNSPGTTTVASIDDGQYVDGKWVRGRRLNGDETDHGRAPERAMQPYRILKMKFFQRP